MDGKILIIADDPLNGQKLEQLFGSEGFESFVSYAPEPVFAFPDGSVPELVIFDITVIEVGSDIVKKLRGSEGLSEIPVIYIIDYDDENKSGLSEFISDKFEFAQRSEDHAEVMELAKNRFEVNSEPEPAAEPKKDTSPSGGFLGLLDSKEPELPEDHLMTGFSFSLLKALACVSESRDTWYKGHARRTAVYAREIMRRMGGSEEEQLQVYFAALVHDIGMISIPADILNKRTELAPDEYERIKGHTLTGAKILKEIEEMPFLAAAARSHHESFDGKGYPDGLRGTDIPRAARIIAVADAYDSMTSSRPYRKAMPQKQVREEFLKGNGTQFDPEAVRIVLQAIYEDKDCGETIQTVRNEWKILLVDDDPMVLKMASYILGRHKQYSCCMANSGKQALKILKDEPDIDLILLDVEMPIMDGVETLIKIRSDKGTQNIPVIFVTADSSRQTLEKAMKYKVNGYITKPFAPHFFLKRINDVLNQTLEDI